MLMRLVLASCFAILAVRFQAQAATNITSTYFPKSLKYIPKALTDADLATIYKQLQTSLKSSEFFVVPKTAYEHVLFIDYFFATPNGDKMIQVLTGAEVEKKYKDKLFTIGNIWAYHMDFHGQPLALTFVGVSAKRVNELIGMLSGKEVSSLETRPVFNWIELVMGSNASAEVIANSPSVISQVSEQGIRVLTDFGGCAVGVADLVSRPFTNLGKGIVSFINDPVNDLKKSADSAKALWNMLSDYKKTASKAVDGFVTMPESERSGLFCSILGPGLLGAYLRAVAGGDAAVVAAQNEMAAAIARTVRADKMAAAEAEAAAKSAATQAQNSLNLAGKLGFNISKRQEAVNLIKSEFDRFTKDPNAFFPSDRSSASWPKSEGKGIEDQVIKSYLAKLEPGQEFDKADFRNYATRQYRAMLVNGNRGLLQVLRGRIEKQVGFDEYYNAYYQVGVDNGATTMSAGAKNNLVFAPGSAPDRLKVYGFSWESSPTSVIQSQTSTPLKIDKMNVLQTRRTEGVYAYPLKFEAEVSVAP